jgi:hypothetical protein
VSSVKKAFKVLADCDILQRRIIHPIESMKCDAVSLTLNMKLIIALASNERVKRPDSVCVPIKVNTFPPVTTPGNDRGNDGGNSPGNDRGNSLGPIRNNPDTLEPNYPNHHNTLESDGSSQAIKPEIKTVVVVVDDLESAKTRWGRMLQKIPNHLRSDNAERLWHVAWLSVEFNDSEMVESFVRAATKDNGIKTSYPGYIEGIRRGACERRGTEWFREKLPQCPPVPPIPDVVPRSTKRIIDRSKTEREVLAEWKAQRRFEFSDLELDTEIDRRMKAMTAEAVA